MSAAAETDDNPDRLQIVLGDVMWIDDAGNRPDGRWLGRTPDGRVTLVKRRDGVETIAFQPIDMSQAVAIAHRVIAGDQPTITDPLSLAAMAAVVAELGLHMPKSEGEGGHG